MKKNILVITDNMNGKWLDVALKHPSKSYSFDILSIGINGEVASHIHKEKYSKIPSFKIVDVNAYAGSAQEKIRKFIPQFIYDFPRKEITNGKSLMKVFRMPDKTNIWWFTEMSEKGA